VSIADSAMPAVKLLKRGTLKVHKVAPHGMCTTLKDQVKEDLLVFIKEWARPVRPALPFLHQAPVHYSRENTDFTPLLQFKMLLKGVTGISSRDESWMAQQQEVKMGRDIKNSFPRLSTSTEG
jgi:uncharacterized protein YecE (DUF72 family)